MDENDVPACFGNYEVVDKKLCKEKCVWHELCKEQKEWDDALE